MVLKNKQRRWFVVADQKKDNNQPKKKRMPPATTPEARENQLIALAVDLAEKQLSNGTASSQVMTHFLKLGSSRDRIERENLKEKNKLLKAQTEAIRSEKRVEELYEEALNAMRSYSGQDEVYDDYDYYDDGGDEDY